MSKSRRSFLRSGGAMTAGALAAPFVGPVSTARAAWLDKPVRIVVPNTPGGPSDMLARVLAPLLQDALGGTFIVENKGGGGGNIGIGSVARAEPDGHTLLLATSVIAVNPALYGDKLPYDPLVDFTYVAELATTPNIFTIDSRLGIGSMQEFIAAAKKDPTKFNIAVPPVTTTAMIGVELLKMVDGLKVGVVVHTGGGQALQSVLSGAVQVSAGALAPALPHIEAGTLKALAIMGDTRWPELPNCPTMTELGYKDYVLDTFLAVFAPANTPRDVIGKLNEAIKTSFARPDIRSTLVKNAFNPEVKGPEGLKARMQREVPLFKDIVARTGIKLNENG